MDNIFSSSITNAHRLHSNKSVDRPRQILSALIEIPNVRRERKKKKKNEFSESSRIWTTEWGFVQTTVKNEMKNVRLFNWIWERGKRKKVLLLACRTLLGFLFCPQRIRFARWPRSNCARTNCPRKEVESRPVQGWTPCQPDSALNWKKRTKNNLIFSFLARVNQNHIPRETNHFLKARFMPRRRHWTNQKVK